MHQHPRDENGLLILGCHAIFQELAGTTRVWHGGFQYRGEDPLLEQQAREAFRIADRNGYAMLCASGGRTRPALPEVRNGLVTNSEGRGILQFARREGLQCGCELAAEEWARDSFENVFFSLLLFFRRFGRWPTRVGVVSFGFKQIRFSLTATALRLPAFDFYGIGNLPADVLPNSIIGEYAYLAKVIQIGDDGPRPFDPLHRSSIFRTKRHSRTPAEYGSELSYLDGLKQHYANGILAQLVDRVEAIAPGEDVQRVPWPWCD